MKLNINKSMTMLLLIISIGTIVAACKSETSEDRKIDSALLFLVGNRAAPNEEQTICLTAYTLANSCVTGTVQLFNPGLGCARETISGLSTTNGTATEQLTALRECVRAAVNDPIQPCNMPQFSYATAGQVFTNYLKAKCSVAEYTIAPATAKTKQDITSLLKY